MNKGLEALQEIAIQTAEALVKKQEPLRTQKINEILETKQFKCIEQELKDKEKFEELVNMDLDLFMKAVDIKGLIEDYQKYKIALEIIKEMLDSDLTQKLNANSRKIFKDIFDNLPKEKQDLLKEIML